MLDDAMKLGFDVQHFEMTLYGRSKQGRSRLLSNSELVQSYSNLYGSPSAPLPDRLAILARTRNDGISFTELLKGKAAAFSDPLKFDEWDDADRLTILRTQKYARHIAIPASTDLIDVQYAPRFLEIIREVAHHYIDGTESKMPVRSDAMTLLQDAKETAIGGPAFASSGVDSEGNGYHEKRLITLFDMPPPEYTLDPLEWLGAAYHWGESLGLPDGSMTFSAALSYRQGAKGHKPQPLFYHDGNEFTAIYEGMSWESNQRLVYPASHAFNVTVTPIVHQMKSFRKSKLGMYHAPEMVNDYIQRLNKQGYVAYESDFSSYDTTISNALMKYAVTCLAEKARKYNWEYNLYKGFLDTTGAIFPSFLTAEPQYVTFFSKAVTLLSGTLPTSELGSIISVSANLYALEQFYPSIVKDWIAGRFIILVQSDDVLFTLDQKIDEIKFSEAIRSCGLTAKLKEGNMFLKKLLPIGTLSKFNGKFPLAGVPLWSRQFQQTFFNESSYDGKPEAVLRLGLLSRAEGLNTHPMFDQSLDKAWKDILSKYPMFSSVVNVLYDGVLALPDIDKQTIIAYSASEDGQAWLSQIYSRADSDPKAKQTLAELAKLGFNLADYEDTALSQRRSYLHAMYASPTPESRQKMHSILAFGA